MENAQIERTLPNGNFPGFFVNGKRPGVGQMTQGSGCRLEKNRYTIHLHWSTATLVEWESDRKISSEDN